MRGLFGGGFSFHLETKQANEILGKFFTLRSLVSCLEGRTSTVYFTTLDCYKAMKNLAVEIDSETFITLLLSLVRGKLSPFITPHAHAKTTPI